MAAALVAIVVSAQWQFKLDTTFRTSITEQNVNSIAIMPNAKLLLSGRIKFPGDMGSPRGSAVILPNGAQDQTFTDFNGGGKLTPWNGKYYVSVGQTVRRLMPNGDLDPTYIAMNWSPYFSSGSGGDYHVFEDGRVLITGNHILSDSIRGFVGWYKLIWFSNEGYLDTTRIHRQANGVMWNFTALADGKFLCSCSCTMYNGQPVGRVFRIHEDGELDTSFETDIYTGNIFDYRPLEDGRVYIAGRFRRNAAPEDTLYLARLMPDGSMDPTFDPPHCSPGDLPNPSSGAGISFIHPWHDGHLIISGRYRYINGEPRNSICMIDSTGNVLPPFHEQGVGTFQYAVNTYSSINHISEDDQGRLYIAGAYTGYNDGTINDPGQRFVSRLLVEEDLTVRVEEQRPAIAFSIHPNPAHEMVTFTYPASISTNARINIRDLSGRLIHGMSLNGHQGQLNWSTTGLAPGTYLVEYVQDDQVMKTEKLIVQR